MCSWLKVLFGIWMEAARSLCPVGVTAACLSTQSPGLSWGSDGPRTRQPPAAARAQPAPV